MGRPGATAAADVRERHFLLAVPLRAAERNRHVAASVLAGGFAYRVFLWLLPFGLVVGGALGLMDAQSTEDAVTTAGLPGAISDAIGDAARASDANWWWLLVTGVPLLLWESYSGAKALQLIHAVIWSVSPPKLGPLRAIAGFNGVLLVLWLLVGAAEWVRSEVHGPLVFIAATVPFAAVWVWVSLQLPHRSTSWTSLVPGALLVAVGVQVVHAVVAVLLVPKLEKSTSLYGGLGATTTVIFFVYLLASLVVAAPILNSSLYEERRRREAVEETPA